MKFLKTIKSGAWWVGILLLAGHIMLAKNKSIFMKPEFYYLKVTAVNCEVKCFLNGFPVYKINAVGEATNQIPVSLYLVGQKNRLDIWMKPGDGQGKVTASGYLYGSSDVVASDDAQKDREVFVVESSDGIKEATFYFDNKKFDFSHVLRKAPINSENEVKEYAADLMEIISNKNVEKLLVEMQPKIADYALAYSASEEMLLGSLEEQLQGLLSHERLKKARKTEIAVVPLCEGRVWELTLLPDLPFI